MLKVLGHLLINLFVIVVFIGVILILPIWLIYKFLPWSVVVLLILLAIVADKDEL